MVYSANYDFPRLQEEKTGEYALQRTREPSDYALLRQLEAQYGRKLLVEECWQQLLPEAGILISPLLSGGTLEQRFREAAEVMPGRCWLYGETMHHFLPLPCPSGQAQPMDFDPQTLPRSFFAEEFCCRCSCSTDPPGLYLFDTLETLEEKIQLARRCGFRGVILPKDR